MRHWSYAMGVALFLVSAQGACAGTANPQVVVTVPALKPYADALLAGIGQSQSLLRPGQDAHTFTLSPSQREMLAHADVILLPDRRMSAMLDPLLDAEQKRGAAIVVLTSFKEAQALPYAKMNPWLQTAGLQGEEHHDKDDEEGPSPAPNWLDPHLWLDPIRMADLARPVAEAIADKSPGNRAMLEHNAGALAAHLRNEVSPAVAEILAHPKPQPLKSGSRPEIPFITYHAAYQYFLKRYNLEAMGEVTQRPEDYLGARTLHDAVEGAEKIHIHCIFSETDAPLVKRLAAASDAKLVPLSPETLYSSDEVPSVGWVRNDYDRLLEKTALEFAKCI